MLSTISNGLTEEQARQAPTYRDQYLNNIYLSGLHANHFGR